MTDEEYLAALEAIIRWPKPHQIDDFNEFRTELILLVYKRHDERKQDELKRVRAEKRREQEKQMMYELDRRSREALRRRQEEHTMWEGRDAEERRVDASKGSD